MDTCLQSIIVEMFTNNSNNIHKKLNPVFQYYSFVKKFKYQSHMNGTKTNFDMVFYETKSG